MVTDALNNLFTMRSMQLMINMDPCNALDEALGSVDTLPDGENFNNRIALTSIYQYMNKHYRNEYFYKNTLLRKLVLGVHSPKTTTALCELPVGDSIADFVLINGHAVVYEIKTELDNFKRLESQTEDYFRAFRYVYIVGHEKVAPKLLDKYTDSPIGIYILNRRGYLSKRKDAYEYSAALDPITQFSILRKEERDSALLIAGFQLPDTSQIRYYRESQKLFESIPSQERCIIFEEILKARKKNLNLEALKVLPPEFKLLGYLNEVSYNDACSLDNFLDMPCKA